MKLPPNTNARHGDPFPIIVAQISLWPFSSARWSTDAISIFSFSFQGVISTTRYHLYTADIFVRSFDPDLCLCDIPVGRWSTAHCEISGWGMQEYNNTASYPDSVRAARIEVTGMLIIYDDDIMLDMLIGWYNNIDSVRVVQMEVTWWYENSFPQLMGTTVLYHDRLAFWGVSFNLVKYKREVNNIVGIERKTQSALFLDWNENILVQQVRCAFNVCHSESARHCGSMAFKSQRSAIFIHECCRNSTKSSCVSSPQLSHVFCVTVVK